MAQNSPELSPEKERKTQGRLRFTAQLRGSTKVRKIILEFRRISVCLARSSPLSSLLSLQPLAHRPLTENKGLHQWICDTTSDTVRRASKLGLHGFSPPGRGDTAFHADPPMNEFSYNGLCGHTVRWDPQI
jgi:hypothetical protein